MSDATASGAVDEESDVSSPTLRNFTAASNEVHMLATLTAAMMEVHGSGRQDGIARRGSVPGSPGTAATSRRTSAGGSERPLEHPRRRRSTSRTRMRTTSSADTISTAGALVERLRSSAQQTNQRSGSGTQISNLRASQHVLPAEPSALGAPASGMTSLRRHVEELSTQLKMARAKQEKDAKVIKDLQDETTRLKQLIESASEVSDAATASLRELSRSRRTCEELRQEADTLQRRAQDSEHRCEQLQQLLRDAEARVVEMEQRTTRVQEAERASVRTEQALEAANERVQNAERRAARAEQVAAQEQARTTDACQRATRAEALAAEDHERALDAERRASRAEHLLEQLQAQVLELERQAARAEQSAEADAARATEADRRAARAEQLQGQERERVAGAERRVARAEDEAEQARSLAVAADRRATLAEDAVGEERTRAEAAERRAVRAEQAAEEAHQTALDAERRAARAAQLQEEAERRAARLEQAQHEAASRVEDAERRAARASQAQDATEARLLEAERRAARAEQAQQDEAARAMENDRRAARAEQGREEALASLADTERRLARAEQVAEDMRAHAGELEKRVTRAELAAQQERQRSAEAERQVARAEQAVEQAQAEKVAADRRAARAEQVAEEVRGRAEEAKNLAAQAEARAARAEQVTAQERERVQEEARHAARMEAAALHDQDRAREAEDRAAAALARAQQAETRMAVAEGHAAALEVRLQQALSYADAADARAVDAERRYDRLAAESRELHAAVVHLATSPDPGVQSQARSRIVLQADRDRSPHSIQWYMSPSAGGGIARRLAEDDVRESQHDVGSPRRRAGLDADARTAGRADAAADLDLLPSPASTPGLWTTGGVGTRLRLWADAYSTPPPEPGSGGSSGRRALDDAHITRTSLRGRGAEMTRMSEGGRRMSGPITTEPGTYAGKLSPLRSPRALGPDDSGGSRRAAGAMDGDVSLVDELRHVRAELRSTRHELNDLKSRYNAACSRVQILEEQAANMERLKTKLEKATAQARKSEHLAAEVKVCKAQLAEVEGLQLELRKVQAELTEAQGFRVALEEARTQLVEMDKIRSETRRVNASLQTVARERDTARSELAEASAQLVGLAALRAQLQRAEAAMAEAEQGREEARATASAAALQQEKLRAQLSTAEEELAEAVRRCARFQAAADEAFHQRERLQVALEGAEGALQAAEEERAVLAAEQERLKVKVQELIDAQEEARSLKAQLQEASTNQRRVAQAEEQAQARVEKAQQQIAGLKTQLAQGQADASAQQQELQQLLQTALGQVETLKAELGTAEERLQDHAKLQADLAANVERGEKAEAQLRKATEEVAKAKEDVARLTQELADCQRNVAKSREETAAATTLATSRGSRVAELEHEVAILREKAYQLEVEVASMTTELHRFKADLASASDMIEEATSARNKISEQLSEANKQQARGVAAASAAEERLKAEMQQLQVRLAAAEAECRALQHTNGNLHDDIERSRSENLALQGQLQQEARHRDELVGECRRLQRELENTSEVLVQAQRAQRSVAAGATELEGEVERLRSARGGLEAELQAANARMQRLQDDVRQLMERNTDLTNQMHGLSATIRQLEAENARLADGHATLTVEAEARGAEVRSARGEAAELAADRARLMAELQIVRGEVERAQAERSELLTRMNMASLDLPRNHSDPRITITGGGIPPVIDASSPMAGFVGGTGRQLSLRRLTQDYASAMPSPTSGPDNHLQALLAAPLDTGGLLTGVGDPSQYEALLAALDEEAQQLDEELAGKEASSSVLLQRMRATKQAITARMENLQTALQAARDAESDMRRQAAEKESTIVRLQQQLALLGGSTTSPSLASAGSADLAALQMGPGGAAAPLGFGSDVLQGNAVISALRQDLDAAHDRLRDAGRQLREAQQRAETAEAEVSRLSGALIEAQSEVARLQAELSANDGVLAEAESALLALVAEKESLEYNLMAARAAERAALEGAGGLQAQVAALQNQLEFALEMSTPPEADPSDVLPGGAYDDRVMDYLEKLGSGDHAAGPADDATEPAAARYPAAMIGPGPSLPPTASLPTANATRALLSAARRYPLGTRTSESESTNSALRHGGPTADTWEGASASGWDNSAAGSMGGATGAASEVRLFPFAVARNYKGSMLSGQDSVPLSPGARQPGVPALQPEPGKPSAAADAGEPEASKPAGVLGSRLSGPVSADGGSSPLPSPTRGRSSRFGDIDARHNVGLRLSSTDDGAAADTPFGNLRSTRVETVHSPSGSSAAGLVMKARASAAAASVAPSSTGTDGAFSPNLRSPLSPGSVSGEHASTEHQPPTSARHSLERLVSEVSPREAASLPPSSQQAFAAALDRVAGPGGDIRERRDRAASAGPSLAAGTALLLQYGSAPHSSTSPQRTPSTLVSFQSYPAVVATPRSSAGVHATRPTATGATPMAATPSTPRLVKPRDISRTPSYFSARSAAIAEAGAALQGASHRLSPSALPTAGPVKPPSSSAESGGGGSGGRSSRGLMDVGATSSPMISPRNTLEGRSLSRAVQRVASALSSPLYPGGISSAAAAGAGVIKGGARASEEQNTPPAAAPRQQDASVERGEGVPSSKPMPSQPTLSKDSLSSQVAPLVRRPAPLSSAATAQAGASASASSMAPFTAAVAVTAAAAASRSNNNSSRASGGTQLQEASDAASLNLSIGSVGGRGLSARLDASVGRHDEPMAIAAKGSSFAGSTPSHSLPGAPPLAPSAAPQPPLAWVPSTAAGLSSEASRDSTDVTRRQLAGAYTASPGGAKGGLSASARRSEEGVSTLAQRLAAMDEALRAIGAA